MDTSLTIEADIVLTLFRKTLTPAQKIVITRIREHEGQVMTRAVHSISSETGISEATVRRAVQNLRELRIIECGDISNKGKPLEVTATGRILSHKIGPRREGNSGWESTWLKTRVSRVQNRRELDSLNLSSAEKIPPFPPEKY